MAAARAETSRHTPDSAPLSPESASRAPARETLFPIVPNRVGRWKRNPTRPVRSNSGIQDGRTCHRSTFDPKFSFKQNNEDDDKKKEETFRSDRGKPSEM